MINVIIGCLLGVLGGAVMSPLLYKWLQKKINKRIVLKDKEFVRIHLPNKLCMTVWSSYLYPNTICACVHHEGKGIVADGDTVYFKDTVAYKILGKNHFYEKRKG